MNDLFKVLSDGKYNIPGFFSYGMNFVRQKQLLNRDLWKRFVDVYRDKNDSNDLKWRCEYWGKMMRGACLCYHYKKDEQLYFLLEETIKDMLSTQDELGRFSSYSLQNEFQSWDLWGRKYTLTGFLHFYDICQNDALKHQIIKAIKKHVDYIIGKVGNKEGQIKITDTSEWWLGVNSSSILEPIVALYNITKEQEYIDFAEYIVKEGGIKGGNLIRLVEENKLLPYQFPENKAYETMSFFEGILEYALAANNKHLYDVAIKFFEDVYNSEISIIGNAGSNDELFSNTCINQIIKPERFCQETCVSVTWMRIMHKLYLITNDYKYHERFIISALNAYYGSINFDDQSSCDYPSKRIGPLPFDSYSPLTYSHRGIATGGLNYLIDGTFYGCCACIGSASMGLIGQDVILENNKSVLINDLFEGEFSNKDFVINIKGDFLNDDYVEVEVSSNKGVILRNPTNDSLQININDKKIISKDNYINLGKGKYICQIKNNLQIERINIGDMIAFKYGCIILALDEESNPDIDLENLNGNEITNFKKRKKDTYFVSFSARYRGHELIFKDYASCGKHWDNIKNKMTVFVKNS